MNLTLTPLSDEQQMIVDTTRRFVEQEIVPLELDLDPDAGALQPADFERLVGKTKEMGFYGLDIPEEYGGPGLDTTTRALMAIEMSQHRAGLYDPCYGTFGGAGLAQLYEATEEQKERWLYPTLRGEKHGCFALTEPSGGSDPARAIQTRGYRDGSEWVLNGSKLYIRLRPPVRPHLRRSRPQRGHCVHRRHRHSGLPREEGGAHPARHPLRHRAAVRGPPRPRGEHPR
jgi:alkylation response protein AidB-like acyl-CoA dehydrogenase